MTTPRGGLALIRRQLEDAMKEAEALEAKAKKAGNKAQMAYQQGVIDGYKYALAIAHA